MSLGPLAPNSFIVAGTALAAFAGGALLVLITSRLIHLIEIVLAFSVIAVALSPLLWRVLQRRFDLLEPLTGGALVLAILFGVRPLATIAQGEFHYHGYHIESNLMLTLLVGLFGTIAFVAGYLLTFANPKARDTPPPMQPTFMRTARGYQFACFMGVLSVGLFLLYLGAGGSITTSLALLLEGRSVAQANLSAASSEYLSAAPILSAAGALAIGVSAGWKLNWRQRIVMLALIAFPLASFFFIGNRRYMIPVVFVPAVAYFLSTGKRPGRRLLLVAAPVAFIFLATIPFGRAAGAQDAAGGLLPIYREAVTAPGEVWTRFINGADTAMVSALAVEIQILDSPERFYYGRASIGDLILAPIPSALFPEKPTTARNEMLIQAFGGPCVAVAGGLCPDFSAIGTFYQDLWLPGVIFGMAILGIVSASGWRLMRRSGSPALVVVVAAWIVYLPILIRAGFMPAFSWFLFFVIPCLAGVMFVCRGSSPVVRTLDLSQGAEGPLPQRVV